jgi:anti-sigma regulatory factor (Ser/Thr protein kinase)
VDAGDQATESFALTLSGGAEAVGAARQALVAHQDALPAAVRDDVVLLLSELVTNSVRHAPVGPDSSLRVEGERSPRRVRVSVIDPGDGFEGVPSRPEFDRAGGWGLFLVDRLADRWGVCRGDAETRVWFEISWPR